MNTTLTGLFTLECVMKIFSFGFRVRSHTTTHHRRKTMTKKKSKAFNRYAFVDVRSGGRADFLFRTIFTWYIFLLPIASRSSSLVEWRPHGHEHYFHSLLHHWVHLKAYILWISGKTTKNRLYRLVYVRRRFSFVQIVLSYYVVIVFVMVVRAPLLS